MGCGCGNKKKAGVAEKVASANAVKPAKAAVKTAVSKPAVTFAATNKRVADRAECQGMYDTLALLERKCVALHNKFRFSQNGYRFAETQKIIRQMISGLANECPDEDEFASVRDYINGEYSKYFNVRR